MRPSAFGHYDLDDAGDGTDRQLGKPVPQRSRSGLKKPKQSKATAAQEKRKLKSPAGIHQRRNKRMSW